MTSPIPIALIGLGNQGREHLSCCLENADRVTIAAACDTHLPPERWPELPESCLRFTDLDAFLEAAPELVRAAIVAIPPTAYREVLPRIIRRGLHVLAEKPLGMNLMEGASLLAEARDWGVLLAPAVQRRFHATYCEVPETLRRMGHATEAELVIEIDKSPNSWRLSERVGTLVDLGFHAIDLARDLFGDLHLRCATLFDLDGHPCHDRFDNSARLLFHTESGTFLRIIVGGSAPQKTERLRVVSATHSLEVDRGRLLLRRGEKVLQEFRSDRDWTDAMNAQLLEFIAACAAPDDYRAEFAGQAGLVTMKLMEEAYDWNANV